MHDARAGNRPRFYFVEPNKVGTQHVSLINELLRALLDHSEIPARYDVVFMAAPSLAGHLDAELIERVDFHPLGTIDGETKRLVAKTLSDARAVTRVTRKMRPDDVLFLSSLWSSETYLYEQVKALAFRNRTVVLMLHGEVEQLLTREPLGITKFGYWIRRWLGGRRQDSTLQLAVLDDFIADELTAAFPAKLSREAMHVVPLPIQRVEVPASPQALPRLCFIGFKKPPQKGYPAFAELAQVANPDKAEFVAVGDGAETNLTTGEVRPIASIADYSAALAACDIAVFPYTGGYRASLSAAAIDAVSAGLHLVATPLGCFTALARQLGPEFVTLCDSPDQMRALFADERWLAERRVGRSERISQLARSRYALPEVGRAFTAMINKVSGAPDTRGAGQSMDRPQP